ncbi:MAG TPA: hypothetical protein VFB24_08525 [Candidatus Binatia bacterium]|nr:hypothetical protein [Candidatus Binatia bacterium]
MVAAADLNGMVGSKLGTAPLWANSPVLRSVSANTTVLGVPAKVIFPPQQPTLSEPQSGFL